ncbi:ABC transporter ATP-binding protein [Mesorhizobium sp. M1148]|jgi:zinc/manganese transport system ATP-binding protein|uniref:metal ABC transporter ATP-binding protein n=1 Tax=unclassified Mesorhizobium TaxID=325217 RepID=UPI0003CEC5BD|nr:MULTISPECIES: ABC transporter ATP-binding protein [unclassified Mesorhizobium]ESW63661.1 ABC transporter ATP-binding protein [Mesorhizobium sp. LSJC277A00]ESX13876.1 ABC transporter ATP-binding protein [Mesorhizobium sp. LSJC265A00]ESX18237.1 ABC transporter ATP-binding protein [Mesorhizobium sp. LSJC255A00]ESX24202.1 ABC transporter ATP-binding protein [Mesorhizobium sp. LSHC440B00]ESX31159.1 ABC transporter ATP-binding protein [Mesorhizobium sp. LSHC432A00]
MNAIEFDKVTLTYGGRRVLSDVSFSLPQGAFVGLLGANGAGKTTMLRAILGLIKPAGGAISVLGKSPTRGNADIGYMPQARRALGDVGVSGLDFVLSAAGGHRWGWPVASAAEKEAAWKALEEVGAGDLARRPLGELSGGERQRILIAQSLIGNPQLLLLDEPLISLDAGHQRAIIDLVHQIGERLGIAVLFCSHEINPLLRAVDRVLYLGNRKAAIGSVDEVISGPVLSKLYGTHINVVRVAGRIFVMADDVELESGAHVHDL